MTSSEGGAEIPAVLEAHGITVRFGGLTALSDVDVRARPSTITGLVGPNGAGKSTLFAVCSGLLTPDRGRVFIGGHDVTTASPQARARLGLARTFQHPELFAGVNVRDHLVLAHRVHTERRRMWTDLVTLRAWRRPDDAEAEAVDGILETLGLTSVAYESALGLPLGLSRLVEVGRALATAPSVVLLDEPSSGLDQSERTRLSDTLREVVEERGTAFVMVEHDVDLVLGLSSEVFVLDFGVMIGSGTPDEIRDNPAVRAAYLGDEPIPQTKR